MINDKVFMISGNKVFSLLIDENSLKFSGQTSQLVEDFNKSWNTKISLKTKTEIKYSSIRYVRKETDSAEIIVAYRGWFGFPATCPFSFKNYQDTALFFDHLEKNQYFRKSNEKLTPLKAVAPYLFGLAMVIFAMVVAFVESNDIKAGVTEGYSSYKTKMFRAIVQTLGDTGIWLLGGGICLYILYIVFKRVKNPPDQVKYTPPG